MLPDDASSMYEASCLGRLPLMCFPSRKSVVTFLILLDWKNIANMVRSGKSFDAGALQINLRMPYGLHSSLNLFPINVYWIFCGANMCVTRLGKQKAGENSLWQSVIIMICPFFSSLLHDRWAASPKQANKQTAPPPEPDSSPLTLLRPIKKHLSVMKLSFPVTSPCEAGYQVTTDREVNRQQATGRAFSERSRLSYSSFQNSKDVTCFLCGCQRYAVKHTFWFFVILKGISAKTQRNKHVKCSRHCCGQQYTFSTCSTFSTMICLKHLQEVAHSWSFAFCPLI